jgi:hypothetical protein
LLIELGVGTVVNQARKRTSASLSTVLSAVDLAFRVVIV